MVDNAQQGNYEKATFAGGCFWCMVTPFEELPGIVSVVSGYIGGHTSNPTYKEVCSETTGHAEAVQITFDPELYPYNKLLDTFWRQIDPTDSGGSMTEVRLIGLVFLPIVISRKRMQKLPSKPCRIAADSIVLL